MFNASIRTELRGLFLMLNEAQLAEYRQRIVEGKIDGTVYVDSFTGCGCLYGTTGLLLGFPGGWSHEFHEWIKDQRELLTGNRVGESDLEVFAHRIYPGHTPTTSRYSAELLTKFDAYMNEERQHV